MANISNRNLQHVVVQITEQSKKGIVANRAQDLESRSYDTVSFGSSCFPRARARGMGEIEVIDPAESG